MKKEKGIMTLMAGTLAAVLMFTGCGGVGSSSTAQAAASSLEPESASVAQAPAGKISVTDMKGREAVLDGPADKVVAISAADCEIVYALGAGDAMVGRGEYCNYPEEVLDVTVVQSGNETNIEEIIALAPQVVLMNTMGQTLEQVKQMENAGIVVLASEATDIAGVYQAIEMIGTALGKDREAEALVSEMKAGFEDLSGMARQSEAKTVYFELSPLEFGLWTSGNATFMDELATMLGLENIFADVEGWAEVSEEQVLERNPDYIVTIGMYMGEGPKPDEEILARSGWGDVTAVKEGHVFALNEDELSRPGPRLVEGAAVLADSIYGTVPEDMASQAA